MSHIKDVVRFSEIFKGGDGMRSDIMRKKEMRSFFSNRFRLVRGIAGGVVLGVLFIAAGVRAEMLYCAGMLQQQINQAHPGEVIDVPPGTFRGTITLGEGVVLRGAGDQPSVLDGDGAPVVVTFAKNSVLIGFTLQNGEVLAAADDIAFGLFECTLRDYSRLGLRIHGGSGVVAMNHFLGTEGTRGIFCYLGNPLITANLIENHRVGIYASGALVPSFLHNRFVGNQVAIAAGKDTVLDLRDNEWLANGEIATGMDPDQIPFPDDPDEAAAFDLPRGLPLETLLGLLDATRAIAIDEHPIILYDLPAHPGPFGAIAIYPWASFSIAVSAPDTRIIDFDAHDLIEDRPLNAEYAEPNNRPTVHVRNPDLLERMNGRYILESWYDHAPSYFDRDDGVRVFRRETSMPRIEIQVPAGFRVISVEPDGVVEQREGGSWVGIDDIGLTQIEILMEPNSIR